MTNGTQEEIKKACGLQLAPVLMVEVIKASNRPAAAIEDTRNQLVATLTGGFQQVTGAVRVMAQLSQNKQEG